MFQDGLDRKRQLWGFPAESRTTTDSHHCTAFTLPSNGVISLAGSAITLTTNVVFQPECTGNSQQSVSAISEPKDPFYASTIPQTYVIAAATVIAWILVVMLIITPRTSFVGNTGAAPAFGNGHGIIGGATGGGTSSIGVGSRPWLQKVAALTVAVSLTIATADTMQVAEQQYEIGSMNATALRDEVLGSLEIRITRVISDVFLWLAQVQTLIRLFPRHKEKVLIKWIGFALILFDSLFSCLNSFMIKSTHQPRHFVDAIPALSYLFELALGLLYAAWVIFYSITKRRYAYYHPKMRSISLIATLSLVAVLTPVVFFVTDVSNEQVAGWGDYFRWVGAAAASVVVWEWVERIEALERDEKKDGILGREIFDGDEMLDVAPSDGVVYTQTRSSRNRWRRKHGRGGDDSDSSVNQTSALEHGFNKVNNRFRHRPHQPVEHLPLGRTHSQTTTVAAEAGHTAQGGNSITFGHLPRPNHPAGDEIIGAPTPPPVVASPISRTETTSAASTVYVVHYHPAADVPQPVRRNVDANGNTEHTLAQVQAQAQRQSRDVSRSTTPAPVPRQDDRITHRASRHVGEGMWHAVQNPFKRKRASPPPEVQLARRVAEDGKSRAATPAHNFSRWDVKNRFGVLAAEAGERLRDERAGRKSDADLPVTVVEAPPRGSGRTWSPAENAHAGPSSSFQPPRGDGSAERAANNHDNGSATQADSIAADTSQAQSSPSRRDSPAIGASGTRSRAAPASSSSVRSAPSRTSTAPPPAAGDLSPVGGRGGTVVVPAPRRPVRSSPLAVHPPSTTDSGSGSEARDSG